MQNGDTAIERKETGIRILFTILFLLIAEVIRIILGLVTLFSLVYALITKRPPGERVRLFANRTVNSYTPGKALTITHISSVSVAAGKG